MKRDKSGNVAQVGRFVGSPQVVAYTATAARSTILKANTIYRLYFTSAAFFLFGSSSVVAVVNVSHPVGAGGIEYHTTDRTNLFVSSVQSSAGGSIFISEVDIET